MPACRWIKFVVSLPSFVLDFGAQTSEDFNDDTPLCKQKTFAGCDPERSLE